MLSFLGVSELKAEEVVVATESTSSAYSIFMNLFPFILIFIIFYFLLIRPQRKKQRLLKEMLAAVKVGDKVLLSSGMTGKVTRIKNTDFVSVEISPNVEVEVARNYIVNVINNIPDAN